MYLFQDEFSEELSGDANPPGSNSNDRPNGASLRLRLAPSATIEEALEDLAEIAAEKGIHLYSVSRRDRRPASGEPGETFTRPAGT